MNGALTRGGYRPGQTTSVWLIKLKSLSPRAFIITTLGLNGSVFLLTYIAAFRLSWYIAEYLCTLGLVLQVAFVKRREAQILWRWPWRFWSAVGLALLTFPFLTSVYLPSPAPFERENMLRTEQVVLGHYLMFVAALSPVLLSCVLTKSNNSKSDSMASAIVRRIL